MWCCNRRGCECWVRGALRAFQGERLGEGAFGDTSKIFDIVRRNPPMRKCETKVLNFRLEMIVNLVESTEDGVVCPAVCLGVCPCKPLPSSQSSDMGFFCHLINDETEAECFHRHLNRIIVFSKRIIFLSFSDFSFRIMPPRWRWPPLLPVSPASSVSLARLSQASQSCTNSSGTAEMLHKPWIDFCAILGC